MTNIYLVRHGETYAKTPNNPLGEPFVCGSGAEISRNIHLTENGKEEMKKVGNEYVNVSFDVCIISDLVRSRESAIAFLEGAEQADLNIEIDKRVTEINYGDFDGVAEDIVKKKKKEFYTTHPEFDLDLKNGGNLSFTFAITGESFKQAADRMRDALLDIALKHSGGNILIISHSGSMRALIGNIIPGQDLKFGQVVKISVEENKLTILN